MVRVAELFLAVDDDTYLNWGAAFDEHILIEYGIGFGTNQRVLVVNDGATHTRVVADGQTYTRIVTM